jgi:hypothetical protein
MRNERKTTQEHGFQGLRGKYDGKTDGVAGNEIHKGTRHQNVSGVLILITGIIGALLLTVLCYALQSWYSWVNTVLHAL